MRRALVVAVLACLIVGCTATEPDPAAEPPARNDPVADLAWCLQEGGWDVAAQPDGRLTIRNVSDDQRDHFESDHDLCMEEVGLNEPRPPRTRAEAEAYWDAMLEAADCVRDFGFPVDEPPSRQAAVEAVMQPSVDLGGWDPYTHAEAAARSQEDINEVYLACPRPQ